MIHRINTMPRFLCRGTAVPAIVELRDDFVVESAWKLGFGHGRSTEPVLLARCPRGVLYARRESNLAGESATARVVRILFQALRAERSCSLRDRTGTSDALCARTSGAWCALYAVTLSGRKAEACGTRYGPAERTG